MRRIAYRFLPVAALLLVLGVLFAAGARVSASPGEGAASAAANGVATFAGGCFWCVEADFEKVEGVLKAVSGFTGGSQPDPSYKHVASGLTRHLETVQVTFDPDVVSYLELLEVFWTHVDPTDPGGQFVDRGHQYTTAIFYADEEQKRTAESSLRQLEQSGVFKKPIVTAIQPLTEFYVAEDGHQDYYKNNSFSYRFYRYRSGRDQFLEATWKDRDFSLREISFVTGKLDWKGADYMRPDDGTLRNQLTDLQYKVTRQDATEPAFQNDYWDNKAEGIYVDVVSGKPLFSSLDKFDSGTGWPSFFKPLEPDNVVQKTDRKFFMTRTEVRSEHADSHLGHLFEDGPAPTGLRYCINSAALRFIPRERLEDEGYGQFLKLFKKSR